jgi:hypothetical protein
VSRKPVKSAKAPSRFSQAPSRRLQVRPIRGECQVGSLTPTCCCTSRPVIPPRRTGPKS